jgi:hypothetical protein
LKKALFHVEQFQEKAPSLDSALRLPVRSGLVWSGHLEEVQ